MDHKVASCIFWGEGCKCHSGKRNEIFNAHTCCGKDLCGSYEYLTKWARYAHGLGKHVQSKREGWLEATWIPKQERSHENTKA